MPPLRLGVFGGTFDPPHFGHLLVAQDAVEALSLHRVLFLVAGLPPHKLGEVLSLPYQRAEMTRAAIAGNTLFELSELELDREGPSYTVDTLRQLRSGYPDAEFFLLLGADQWAEFHEWRDPWEIAKMATLVVVGRNGSDPAPLRRIQTRSGAELEVRSLEVTRIDISSSKVRARAREGRSIRYMVPEDVRRIIQSQGLYRSIS